MRHLRTISLPDGTKCSGKLSSQFCFNANICKKCNYPLLKCGCSRESKRGVSDMARAQKEVKKATLEKAMAKAQSAKLAKNMKAAALRND